MRFSRSLFTACLICVCSARVCGQQTSQVPKIDVKGFERYQNEPLGVRLVSPENAWVVVEVQTTDSKTTMARGSGFLPKGVATVVGLSSDYELKDDTKYSVKIVPQFLQDPSLPSVEPVLCERKQTRYRLARKPNPMEVVTDVTKDWEPTVVLDREGSVDLVFDTPLGANISNRYYGKATGNASERKFSVRLVDVRDDYYRYHFEGESDNLKLVGSGDTYVLRKDTTPVLMGLMDLSVDDQDNLSIQFHLSRKVTAALKFSDGIQLPEMKGTGEQPPYEYETKFSLNASNILEELKGAAKDATYDNPKRPMVLTLINKSASKEEEVGRIRLYVVRVDAMKLLGELTKVKGKVKDDATAARVAKDALGIKGEPKKNSPEAQAVDYLVSILKEEKPKREKFMAFAMVAAKTAATFFGIPVSLP